MFDTGSLWDFSLIQYAKPGVADACLTLQDKHGADVNLLLWSLWMAQRGILLDQARLDLARKHIQPWHAQTVLPLRQLRRALKAQYGTADKRIEAVRAKIKAAELAAEQQVQYSLEQLCNTWPPANGATPATNLAIYFEDVGIAEKDWPEWYRQLALQDE